MRDTTVAGEAIRASLPPFTWDKCFLTVFNSSIEAPALRRSSVTIFLSPRVMLSAGETNNAEAPPEMRQITRVSSSACFSILMISSVPFTPASSGTGCDASITFILFNFAAWPYFTIIRPSVMNLPKMDSIA